MEPVLFFLPKLPPFMPGGTFWMTAVMTMIIMSVRDLQRKAIVKAAFNSNPFTISLATI